MNISKIKIDNQHQVALVVIFHTIFVALTYYLCGMIDSQYIVPNDVNLIQFDAHFYNSIRQNGYEYVPGVGNNLAFFPLFPLFWKWTGLDASFISIINYIIFSVSFFQLIRDEKLHFTTMLLIISLPSFIFLAVPYSESLFFLFCTFIVVGYKKKSNIWLIVGLIGASMVRSVCVVFIPAIIICELFSGQSSKIDWVKIRELCSKVAYAIVGLLLAMIYVAYETGTWFYFIEIQKYWHREWLMVKFPLTTMSPERVLGIDGVAFIIGLIAIGFTLTNIFIVIKRVFFQKKYSKLPIDQGAFFSALYIAGITILDTFFTKYHNQETNIWSLNRHVVCTPFAITFFIFLIRDYNPARYAKWIIAILILAGMYITGVFQFPNLKVLQFYLLFFFSSLTLKFFPDAKQYFPFYYLTSIFLQISFFSDYLHGQWLG